MKVKRLVIYKKSNGQQMLSFHRERKKKKKERKSLPLKLISLFMNESEVRAWTRLLGPTSIVYFVMGPTSCQTKNKWAAVLVGPTPNISLLLDSDAHSACTESHTHSLSLSRRLCPSLSIPHQTHCQKQKNVLFPFFYLIKICW